MVFQHELSAVPPALINAYGCLRTGDKSAMVRKSLRKVVNLEDLQPDVILIDGGQLLYHVSWPAAGTGKIKDLADGIQNRITQMPSDPHKKVIFDKYNMNTAKEHERQRRAGEGSTEYNIVLNTTLAGRDSIMKNTANKRKLCNLLCTYDLGPKIDLVCKQDTTVEHDEADVSHQRHA